MTRLQALEDFQEDMNKLHVFLNECGQSKPINILDPNQDLNWVGYSVEKLLNWIQFEIEEENSVEDENLPDEGLQVGAMVGE